MKKTSKIFSVVLALVFVFAMAIPAFAAGDGKITIDNAVANESYTIYQIVELESFSGDNYSYKVTDTKWKAFLETKDELIEIDDAGFVTWIGAEDDATVAQFAKDALAYAKANGITGTTKKAEGETVVFGTLDLGWYLVDSSVGTLCNLTTTAKEITISDKNTIPEITKEVKEDDTGAWGESNTSGVGETVEFRSTITVAKGTENYKLHDTMETGLSFDGLGTIKVQVNGADVAADNYTATLGGEHCTFEIAFADNYILGLAAGTEIVVTYTATVTEDAIDDDALENKVNLTYGTTSETEYDYTYTYTFEFDLVKTDNENVVLDDAVFSLYTVATGGTPVQLVKDGDVYRVATAAELADDDVEKVTEVTVGQATFAGFDNGTYYFEEVEAPDGYNKLTDRVSFMVNGADKKATFENDKYKEGGVQVINQSGSVLPSTGGIGTTIFYILGGLLVVGAAIVLITRKRSSVEA